MTAPRLFKIAIRNDHFEYIDFMLAHEADINACNDLLSMVVNVCADDTRTLQRIRFLVSRGLETADSLALRHVVAAGNSEIAACLIDCGVRTESVITWEVREDYQVTS